MAYRWETPTSVGLEDESSGQFALQATDGLQHIDWQAHARDRLPDVAHLLGASLPLSCGCAGIYPEGFAFCPTCGRPLDKLLGRTRAGARSAGVMACGRGGESGHYTFLRQTSLQRPVFRSLRCRTVLPGELRAARGAGEL